MSDYPYLLFLIVSRLLIESFIIHCRLANQMRMLNYSEWMKLVTALFSNLLIILGRVRVFSL